MPSPRRRGARRPPPVLPGHGHRQAETALKRALRQTSSMAPSATTSPARSNKACDVVGGSSSRLWLTCTVVGGSARACQRGEGEHERLAAREGPRRRMARRAAAADARRKASGRGGPAVARPASTSRRHGRRVRNSRARRGSGGPRTRSASSLAAHQGASTPRPPVSTTARADRARRETVRHGVAHDADTAREAPSGRSSRGGPRARSRPRTKGDARRRAGATASSCQPRSDRARPSAHPCGWRGTRAPKDGVPRCVDRRPVQKRRERPVRLRLSFNCPLARHRPPQSRAAGCRSGRTQSGARGELVPLLVAADDDDRTRGVAQQVLGDRANENARQGAVAVRADDEEIRSVRLRQQDSNR